MKTKHTPGPWTVNGRWVSQGEHRTICNATEMTMKSLVRQAAEYEQACANAQLIAAAPDMLEALEFLLDTWTMDDHSRQLVNDVIRKARGES